MAELEDRTLRGVGQHLQRLLDLHPAHLVEFVVVVLGAAADRPHQVEMDGLVEAGLAADEEVGDRVSVSSTSTARPVSSRVSRVAVS